MACDVSCPHALAADCVPQPDIFPWCIALDLFSRVAVDALDKEDKENSESDLLNAANSMFTGVYLCWCGAHCSRTVNIAGTMARSMLTQSGW
eukprot:6201613-Pleurochrysis_carterae.AAC.2